MSENDVFGGVGVEISLAKPDDFLKVKETLTRIGVSAKKDNILYQSCHILHKRGRYAIVHFKELFILDGKASDIVENDYARRNTIVNLLAEWNLVKILDPAKAQVPAPAPISQIKIIPHKDKSNWNLVAKYTIGGKKKVTANT
jgi:hypothetical protein